MMINVHKSQATKKQDLGSSEDLAFKRWQTIDYSHKFTSWNVFKIITKNRAKIVHCYK